ncbi:hypothetical protein [Flavobacterium sp. UBA4854]|uniref:hypothetical protein n=1 Tax=Flavobacterium sp. UBA4854 TaxID=1946548 RepID=UPI00257B664F|nr:hypothetical protein [Flavobacterium sp. UBA4854]
METSAIIQKVLQVLACSYARSCSLEELAQQVSPAFKSFQYAQGLLNAKKQKQVMLLETLMLLDQQGLIFLDPETDQSVITIKGMLQVNDKVLCN